MNLTGSVLSVPILAVLFSTSAHAQRAAGGNDQYAPLPAQIVSAKTVFLMNETGKAKFGDAIYKQIKTWNRWQVVTSKDQADLVLVVTDKGGAGSLNPSFYLNVVDPKTSPRYGRVERQCKGSSGGRGTLSLRHCSGTFGSGFEKLLNSQTIQLSTAEENCKPMANASPFKGLQ